MSGTIIALTVPQIAALRVIASHECHVPLDAEGVDLIDTICYWAQAVIAGESQLAANFTAAIMEQWTPSAVGTNFELTPILNYRTTFTLEPAKVLEACRNLALHIGGQWLSQASGGQRAVINPADESVLAMLPLAGVAELQAAADAVLPKAQGDAVVWFAYPKGTSKRYKCEFNRDSGWAPMGAAGFEGVRMVAIDEDWSAFRFRRVEHIKTMKRDPSRAATEQGKARVGKMDPKP